MRPELLLLPAAFLAGSIPFGLLIARARGVDIRKHGSGNIGATNVGRVLGRRYFFLCFALDFLKGFGPTLAAGVLFGTLGRPFAPLGDTGLWLGTMAAAVLGHVFCPWLKFKGGKGVATGLGALVAVYPVMTFAGLGALLIWLATIAVWRYVSLSSILAALALPPLVLLVLVLWERGPLPEHAQAAARAGWPYLAVAAAMTVLVLWTHRANMSRLRSGTESKFF